MNERDRAFADAARVIEESVVMRLVHRSVDLVGRAFEARRMPALKGPAYNWILMIAVACLTHALLLQWIPDRIAPVKPLAYGMVVAFGAFGAVAGFITTRSNATATADSSAGTANTRKS
jgi:hypothetical protein